MDLAHVIGTIVATRKDPSLVSCKICVIQPVDEHLKPMREPLIATDATSSRGRGDLVYFVESGDAVFTSLTGPPMPVDAAIVGIVDDMKVIDDAPAKPKPKKTAKKSRKKKKA